MLHAICDFLKHIISQFTGDDNSSLEITVKDYRKFSYLGYLPLMLHAWYQNREVWHDSFIIGSLLYQVRFHDYLWIRHPLCWSYMRTCSVDQVLITYEWNWSINHKSLHLIWPVIPFNIRYKTTEDLGLVGHLNLSISQWHLQSQFNNVSVSVL